MTRTILFTASLASAVGIFALGAQAQDEGTQAPVQVQEQERMSIAEVATMLESQGYTVREIEFEHGRYDVEMTDANGIRAEAYLDPVTGEVLPDRDDDDERYERDDD